LDTKASGWDNEVAVGVSSTVLFLLDTKASGWDNEVAVGVSSAVLLLLDTKASGWDNEVAVGVSFFVSDLLAKIVREYIFDGRICFLVLLCFGDGVSFARVFKTSCSTVGLLLPSIRALSSGDARCFPLVNCGCVLGSLFSFALRRSFASLRSAALFIVCLVLAIATVKQNKKEHHV